MSFTARIKHFNKLGFFSHSAPGVIDAKTFIDKCVWRRQVSRALKDIENGVNVEQAKETLQLFGYYKDYQGEPQTMDNPNMCAGRAVQLDTDKLFVEELAPTDAYAEAVNYLNGYQSAEYRNQGEDAAVIEHKLTPKYDAEGNKPKKDTPGTHSEFELVCANAVEGLRESFAGANQITGEIRLEGTLPGCTLGYVGVPDYQEGGVELKTQWDKNAHTDKPAANSLPKSIKENHLNQIAGYHFLSGLNPTIVYANRLGYAVFKATEEELAHGLNRIVQASKRRERLMMAADTVEELLRLTDPQWNQAWLWDIHPKLYAEARKIWGE